MSNLLSKKSLEEKIDNIILHYDSGDYDLTSSDVRKVILNLVEGQKEAAVDYFYEELRGNTGL